MSKESLTEIIADGLDASMDGRGYDKRHHAAFELANAAPDMAKALKRIVNSDMAMREEDEGRVSVELNLARAALAKAGIK